ncbi:DUF6088 family protein [Lachnospira multipara]|uniref:DUF6088 family protein n=1 Tax=Lachnospira multipara TaxID=28051 RepID=UPI0004009640|nr:DUF6088 family protein [Lachnospira multipara]
MRDFCQPIIEDKIRKFNYGHAFTAADFLDFASVDAANKALSRLNELGTIRRVIKGVYEKADPYVDIDDIAPPDPVEVAKALARKFSWRIGLSDSKAARYVGVGVKYTNHWTFISDGPNRKYEVAHYVLQFKHRSNKVFEGKSFETISLYEALKFIGEDNIDEKVQNRISNTFDFEKSDVIKWQILKEVDNLDDWVSTKIKEILI